METISFTTTNGSPATLHETTISVFKERLHGPLLRPGDAGYDAARRVWNGMIDRRPALIARCTGAADVTACVNFAREHGLLEEGEALLRSSYGANYERLVALKEVYDPTNLFRLNQNIKPRNAHAA